MSNPFQKLLAHIENEILDLTQTGWEISISPEHYGELEYEVLLRDVDEQIHALESHADRLRAIA